jgi:hypothetical protein
MSTPPADDLRELIPPHSRAQISASMCCPIELGQLLDAAPPDRPLLAFAPPLGGLGAAAAGVLRAARECSAAVLLRVDLGTSQAAVSSAAFSALVKACEESRYNWPIGLLAQVPASPSTVGSGATARSVADALGAGFPSIFVTLPIAAEAETMGVELLGSLALLKERELGWALGLAVGSDSREGQAWLSFLTERESLPVAVRCASRDGLPAALRHWRPTRGNEQLDQRERIRSGLPALVDVALAMPHGARADRAEAFAYFAAETAFAAWEQERSAVHVADRLRDKWKGTV